MNNIEDPNGTTVFSRPTLFMLAQAILWSLTQASLSNVDGQPKRPITPEDIVNIRKVSDPQISPNGHWITFVVTEPADTNQPELPGNSDIWIVSSDGSEPPRQYALSHKQERMPRWSPDGHHLAFLSNRGKDDKFQIFLMPTDGGEAEAITHEKEGVDKYQWLSDSKMLAYLAKDPLTPEEEEKQKAKDDARVVDENYKYNRLYEVNVDSRKVTLITKQDENITEFDYSPDSRQVALVASATSKPDDIIVRSKLAVVNRDGSQWRILTEKAHSKNVRWSQDGRTILYFAAVGKLQGEQPSLISPKDGSPNHLSPDYKGQIWEIDWMQNRQSVLVSSQEGVQGIIGKLDVGSGVVKTLKRVGRPYDEGPCWSLNANGNLIAYVDARWNSPQDVWIMKADGSDAKRLTTMNPQVESFAFGTQEVIQWNSKDGTSIEGVLVKPVDYKKARLYPLIVQVHGGPTWAIWNGWLPKWNWWGQLLASHGYIVLLPNPRGSHGYGQSFMEGNFRDWGGGDFEDIQSGVDYLIEQGIADPQRLGIGGWSYGGYMSAWAVTQTDRFRVAVMGAGISNMISMYGSNDIPSFMRLFFGCHPYDGIEIYAQHSPLTFVKQAQTPTLILHGEADDRVPVSQSYEFYRGLHEMRVETQMVVYPRERHQIKERAHQIDVLQRVLAWYEKHLKNK